MLTMNQMSPSVSYQTTAPASHSFSKQSIMVQAKTWVLTKHFDGFPKKSDFELRVEELPEPKDGGKMMSGLKHLNRVCAHLNTFVLSVCFRGAFGGGVSQCRPVYEVSGDGLLIVTRNHL